MRDHVQPTADCANCKHPYRMHTAETTDHTVKVKGKDLWHFGSTMRVCHQLSSDGRCLCSDYTEPKRHRRDKTPKVVVGWQ